MRRRRIFLPVHVFPGGLTEHSQAGRASITVSISGLTATVQIIGAEPAMDGLTVNALGAIALAMLGSFYVSCCGDRFLADRNPFLDRHIKTRTQWEPLTNSSKGGQLG